MLDTSTLKKFSIPSEQNGHANSLCSCFKKKKSQSPQGYQVQIKLISSKPIKIKCFSVQNQLCTNRNFPKIFVHLIFILHWAQFKMLVFQIITNSIVYLLAGCLMLREKYNLSLSSFIKRLFSSKPMTSLKSIAETSA